MDHELAAAEREAEARPGDPGAATRLARALVRCGREHEALDRLRAAARATPLTGEADTLRGQLAARLAGPLPEPALREALGRALGLGGPYPDPPGLDTFHLHGGALDAQGRVAWVEETQREGGGGWVDAAIVLRVAAGGRELLRWDLAHYNPYFGCTLWRIAWWEERVLLVYHEKHRCLLALVPLEGPPQLVDVDDGFAATDDLLLFERGEPGLLEAVGLPDLAPRLPLPVELEPRGAPLPLEDDLLPGGPAPVRLPAPHQRGFPADAQAFLAGLRAEAFGPAPPQPGCDLLLGAATFLFWWDRHQRRATYAHPLRWWNSPHWLPVYWARHLRQRGREDERAAFLALLASLAARAVPARGWDPAWSFQAGALRLAREHVERRAALLLPACREERLPAGSWCAFWAPWSQEVLAPDLERFPAGFGQVVRELAATRPERLG